MIKDITIIVNILQFIGGLWLTFGYIPQIAKTLKTKKVEDLSLIYYINIFGGVGLMELYSIWNCFVLHTGTMFFVTNTIAWICGGTMLVLTFAYSRPKHIEKMKAIEEVATPGAEEVVAPVVDKIEPMETPVVAPVDSTEVE